MYSIGSYKNKIMTLIKLVITFHFVFFLACSPSRLDQAVVKLQEAVKLKDEGNINLARLKLDTLILQYSDQPEQIREAKELLRQINISEQERNIHYLDSMLLIQEERLEPMMKNFIVTDEYGTKKIFIHRRQRPENCFNRTFLRAHLNEFGDFFISSRYHGTKWINHHQIKVYYKGQSVSSESVPQDEFDNRQFEDGENKWEIVNYKDGKDNGIIDFIASNWNEPLRVQYIGQAYEYIIMEQFDREAIRDGYEISFILKEIKRIKEEISKINSLLQELKEPSKELSV